MKSILVHLDASPRSAERLTLAQTLGRRHEAEVTAAYGVLPSVLAMPWLGEPGGAAALLARNDDLLRDRARALFERHAALSPMRWLDTSGEWLQPALFQQALLSDLLVLGQADAQDAETGPVPRDLVATLLIDSGRPALVLPWFGDWASTGLGLDAGRNGGLHLLLAWKGGRESARAASAALPWLRRARRVHLALPEPAGSAGAGVSAGVDEAGLSHWLRLHGVSAPLQVHRVRDASAGEDLLSLAADCAAGLLVMGCYGHGRTREWLLGGATRTLLQSMTLPVLMVH